MKFRPRGRLASRVLTAFVVAAVVVCAGVGAAVMHHRLAGPSARRVIETAFAGARPFAPRMDGMPFGRLEVEQRTPGIDVATAAAQLELDALRAPSASTLRWAAVAKLLTGDVDGGVTLLEKATGMSSGTNSACDLAAAYFVRASRRGDNSDLVRSVDTARRALAVSPDRSACWFNLGVASQQMGLLAMADEAFERAAALEPGEWAAEARARHRPPEAPDNRDDLSRRLAPLVLDGDPAAPNLPMATDSDVIEELLERQVLRRWAEAVRSDRSAEAVQARSRARILARRLAAENGDRYPVDLVEQLDGCGVRCAAGWIDYLDALSAWDAEQFAAARQAMARADAAFGTRPDVFNVSRVLLRVTLARLDGAGETARQWLRAHDAYCASAAYLRLSGRITWQLALIESETGNFGGAVVLYRTAADRLARAKDREGAAMVDSLMTSKYQQLGDFTQAWAFAVRALRQLSVCRELRQRAILSAAASLATASSLDEAAMALRAPLVAGARRTGPAIYLARLLSEEATTLERLGRTSDAMARLDEASREIDRIDDPGGAAMIRALVLAARGRLLAAQSPVEAAATLGEAVEMNRRRGNFFAVAVLELERGRALLRAGAVDAAQQAFVSGIDVAERERQSGGSDDEKVGLHAAGWDLYTSLAGVLIQKHDERGALRLLDRGRAINLMERLDPSPAAASPRLPDGTVALEYASLPSGVSGWISAGNRRVRFPVGASAADLATAVEEYRTAIVGHAELGSIKKMSRRLFSMLLEPVRGDIERASHIVVVPDGPLHALPFASLEDPLTGAPLIERAAVTITPSLALYEVRDGRAVSRPFDAVIVGNANGGRDDADALARLPAVDREVQAVAGLYGRSKVLNGPMSTREAFLDAAPLGRVVHFAGHAIVDEKQPNLSRLLVSPSPRDGLGAVFAKDISLTSFAGVRMVVLSACDTARGRVSPGEGVMGLARAFLGAGAASVVATLWPVEDEHAFALALAMHRELIKGQSASDALRAAQLAALHGGKSDVADWAGTIVIGRDVAIADDASRRQGRHSS